MCIIAAKPAGVEMPDNDTISNIWSSNPHGAGLMYALNGMVYIRKGCMTLPSFEEALSKLREKYDLDSLPLIMHFRIGNRGSISPENTHPFPVSDSLMDLHKARNNAKLAVAHNGTIPIKPRNDISDTMEYILTELAPLNKEHPEWYHDSNDIRKVTNAIESRMALLTGDGEIITIGDFIKDNGILYSNYSYLYRSRRQSVGRANTYRSASA